VGIFFDGNSMDKSQQTQMLYAEMAQLAFTEIRNLAFGRTSLQQDVPEFPNNIAIKHLLQNLFIAGQLAEAMHNFPTVLYDDYGQYLTLSSLCQFIDKNPKYQETFQDLIVIALRANHRELAEIDADWFATIVDKYQRLSE